MATKERHRHNRHESGEQCAIVPNPNVLTMVRGPDSTRYATFELAPLPKGSGQLKAFGKIHVPLEHARGIQAFEWRPLSRALDGHHHQDQTATAGDHPLSAAPDRVGPLAERCADSDDTQ